MEREFSENQSIKKFFGVDGEGRMFRKATTDEIENGAKNLVTHTKTKGASSGEVETRKIVKSLYGIITSFHIKTSDEYGDSLVVEISEQGATSVLQVPLSSDYAGDIIKKVENLKAGYQYEFSSWRMQATEKETKKVIPDKFIKGMKITDSVGDKIEKTFTIERQKEILPFESAPFYKADEKYQSKDFWQTYFKMLTVKLKETIIPEAKMRFQMWMENNGDKLQSVTPQATTQKTSIPQPSPSDNDWLVGMNEPPLTDDELLF